MFHEIAITILICIALIILVVPPVIFLVWYFVDKRQSQHSILRNFPLLGRIRYIFEMMGPELRQYMFDSD
ncbi:MAG: FMN-binding glutamate synthase family protein, partial [Candidatus Marinimicrobia bacterium]|nr:FMN-binding glutamate synthase family protein [Candidatus Neomarinimicrobiota bacterium]